MTGELGGKLGLRRFIWIGGDDSYIDPDEFENLITEDFFRILQEDGSSVILIEAA